MTDTIRIDLDSVRVYRNRSEWRTVPLARSSLGHEITGYGPLLARLASILRSENPRFDGLLEVFRGDTPCFVPMPLNTAFRKGPQPQHLKKDN